MPFGIDLPDIDLPDLNPFDDDEDEKKRKGRKKGKRPAKVPKTTRKKREEEDDDGFFDVVKHLVTPGAAFSEVAKPVAKHLRAPKAVTKNIEHIAELGAGLLPAAKTIGGIGYRDARRLSRASRRRDMPDLGDVKQYYDLLKWTLADEKGDKRKRPKTDSEIVGLLGELMRGWQRGIEKAVPDITDPADIKQAKKAWTDDLVFTLLDVLPVGAAVTRPLSVAKHTRNIGRANDIKRGKALAAGIKESYVPGSARRRGLEGGIQPRTLQATVGGVTETAGGRPWSRIPLIRELQRATDEVYGLSPTLSRKRVGRAQERLAREEKRRVDLEKTELERPVSELLYGRVGRLVASFGLKEGMSAKERRAATGLSYAFQMPKNMHPEDALKAVQDDMSEILQSGAMEVPRGRGRVKSMPLNEAQRQNLAIQISDLDLVRQELRNGDISPDEWDAGLEAMQGIADKTHAMGINILGRRLNLDEEGIADLERLFDSRASMLPRRLAARGRLDMGDMGESPARAARIAELTERFGEDEARALTVLTDSRARRANPEDPAQFWEQRVGEATGESAEEYIARIGDEALFPQTTLAPSALTPGEGVRALLDTGEFYSPLQKWVDETMPDKMPAAQLQGTLRNKIPPEEWENIGLDNFFHDLDPTEMVHKTDFQAFMASPLNAYNLREILLSNHIDVPEDLGTIFDRGHNGNYISREPEEGEYFELLLQLPGPPRYGPEGKGYGHWERNNIAAHVRFHIFQEDGVRKMLVEEIQSDWANEWRVEKGKLRKTKDLSPEEREDIDFMRENLARSTAEKQRIQTRQREINDKLERPDHPEELSLSERTDAEADLHMEYYNNADRLDNLNEYIRDVERAYAEFGVDGTPVSPLGTGTGPRSSYVNPAVRWLLRRADEAEVDEIHIVGRETQLARNNELLDPQEIDHFFHEGAEATTAYIRKFIDDGLYTGRAFIGYDEDLPRTFAREMGEEGIRREDAYEGGYRHPREPERNGEGRMPATVFRMTEGAKTAARKPGSMYQRQPDWKGLPHGAAELLEGRSIIHLFETGNVSTWIHELGHVSLYDLDAADLRVIETHLGGGFKLDDWTKMEHERFARAFEQYVRKGTAPNKELASVFGKISEWMKVVWKQAKGKNVEIRPEVREVFDRMFDKPPVDELQPWGYFPHRDIHADAQTRYRGGVRPPAAGQVIGVPRLTGETVQRKPNELLLYQGGSLNPDPGGLVNVFLNRLRFEVTLDARDDLWAAGRSMDDPPPKGTRVVLVRNPDATPERITPEAQKAARGERTERPIEDELDEMLQLSPDEFRQEVIALVGENPRWASDAENVRWVEADYVQTRFGEVFEEGPRGSLGSALGLLTSMQRATGIYGRPISYVGGNVPFNIMALLSSMPVSTLRNVPRMLEIRKNDPALYRALVSEGGETRAGGGLPDHYVSAQNRTQQAEQRATRIQRGMAQNLSEYADDPFRAVAILNNARKRGYTSNADLRRLVEENGTDLHEVRQLAREQMLDFDALNPAQRKIASRLLYLWPFMYASIKWPAMFAREYPARAAAAAQAIEREPEKGLPQEVTNLWKRYGIDLTTLNPAGPLGQVAEDLSLLTDDPSKLDLTALQERLSPTLGALVEGMAGGRKNALQNFVRGTVPGASELLSADPEFRGAKVYEDRSRDAYLGQRHLRYWPRGINRERLGEMIDDALADKVKGTTIEKEMDADWKKITKYGKAVGGYSAEDAGEIRRSYTAWWEYQEAVEQKKDSLGQRKLTPYQQIEVLQPIVEERFPEVAGDLWDMTRMKDRDYQRKYEKALDEYASALKDTINAGRTMIFNDYRSFGPEE